MDNDADGIGARPVLDSDGLGHTAGRFAQRAGETSPTAPDRPSYWARYRRRWVMSGIVIGIATALAGVYLRATDPDTYPDIGVVDLAFAAGIGFLSWGTLLTFLVAIPSTRAKK